MSKDSILCERSLSPGTILNQTYVIQEVLGEGGFGITYRGVCQTSHNQVAIKEYFPKNIALRTSQDGVLSLRPISEKDNADYEKGRSRFLKEAKHLIELQHLDSIVSVYDYFEENDTAYIVMEYIEGLTLGKYVRSNEVLSFDELLPLILPVIRSLSQMHDKGVIHRDISPDNLILGTDNRLHVIDFGAASMENNGNNFNTVILKAGYTPPEQYLSNGKVGAWIDVYSLCATMYFALTGQAPSEAIHRLDQDSLEPLASLPNLFPWQKAAIEKGLQLRSANRFRNMEELYRALTTAPEDDSERTVLGTPLSKKDVHRLSTTDHQKKRWIPVGILIFIVVIVAGWIGLLWRSGKMTSPKADETPVLVLSETSLPVTTPSVSASPARTETPTTNYLSTEEDSILLSMLDLSELSLKQAKKALKKLDPDIQLETIRVYHDQVEKNHVITQSIAAKTPFSKGHLSSILLTISKGKKPPTDSSPSKAPQRKTSTPKPDISNSVQAEDDYTTIGID